MIIKRGIFMEILLDCVKAFIVGGVFCVIGQILIDRTKLTPARILVGYVVSGVILTAVGVYDYIVDFAGAGATVPLTGFGYSLAKGVEKAVIDYGLIGALSGGLTATSAGIAADIFFGLLAALVSGKGKKLS
jgi:stage V sporulation protein AE